MQFLEKKITENGAQISIANVKANIFEGAVVQQINEICTFRLNGAKSVVALQRLVEIYWTLLVDNFYFERLVYLVYFAEASRDFFGAFRIRIHHAQLQLPLLLQFEHHRALALALRLALVVSRLLLLLILILLLLLMS
jgi:hypothetical protein